MNSLRSTARSFLWLVFVLLAAVSAGLASLYATGGFGASGDFQMGTNARREAVAPVASPDQDVDEAPRPQRALVPTHLFQIVARRGDCWLEVRQSSAKGAVLFEGLLAAGQAVRLKRVAIWVSAGAAANLDVLIDGKPLAEPLQGTIATVLPARGPAT